MKSIVRGLINALARVASWANTESTAPVKDTIYAEEATEDTGTKEEVHSIWDYLEFVENSQAFHIVGIVGFEEWIDMEEIKRRIQEIYGIEYGNDRSLYPYIKTLADAGLFESTSAGGRRKWRKRDLLIRIGAEKRGARVEATAKKEKEKRRD